MQDYAVNQDHAVYQVEIFYNGQWHAQNLFYRGFLGTWSAARDAFINFSLHAGPGCVRIVRGTQTVIINE